MPSNTINPFNYNIDSFDSGFLGPISDTNFRNWLFTHNLPVVNPIIGGIIGNAWADRGNEYDVSQSNPNVLDVPNLTDVANTPSVHNNLTNPRIVNLSSNIPSVNPEVAALGITNQDLGVDAAGLLNQNSNNIDLPSVEDVSDTPSVYNNFTYPRQDTLDKNPDFVELATWYPNLIPAINQYGNVKGSNYGVPQTLKLGFAGNVESWVSDGGYVTTTSEIRDTGYFKQNNVWGPASIVQYSVSSSLLDQNGAFVQSNNQVLVGNTGFKQYATNVQGDFRDQLFSRTLGVGIIPFSQISSGINYKPDGQNPSQLDVIARKRRGVELANRLKLNFIDNTVGAINTSPFGLLAGGNLIERDYTITVPKTKTGKAARFLANLSGFNLPTSIIPDDAFQQTTGQQINVPDALLDHTGSGQKSLLFDALYINKYGPTLGNKYSQPATGEVKKSLAGAGQPPNTRNYLSEPQQPTTKPRTKSLVDTLNDKIDGLLRSQQPPSIPIEGDKPTIADDQYGGFYGKFEPFEAVGRSFSEKNGFGNEEGLLEVTDFSKPNTTYNGTTTEQYTSTDQQGTVSDKIDWRKRSGNPYKKGILKYTQEVVNKSKLGDAAGYIGYFDSAESLGNEEYKQDIDKHGHLTGVKTPTTKPTLPSKGNTVRNYEFNPSGPGSDTGGEFYCRSWSSRRKYHTWDNLVRGEGNWWRVQKDWSSLMTLNYAEDPNGQPKIAWTSRDNEIYGLGQDLVNANSGKFSGNWGMTVSNHGLAQVMIPYMFSIENLAWKDSPHASQLPPCERGPNGGRIMWFPPYDLDFSDNTTVNMDTTSFIGRGEPIYTYNHTERSGTLSFKIVVDHPSVLNELKNRFKDTLLDEGYHSFFAGCSSESIKKLFADYLPNNAVIAALETENKPEFQPITPKIPNPPPYNDLKVYFENTRTADIRNGVDYRSPNGLGRTPLYGGFVDGYEITLAAMGGDYAGTPICGGTTGLNDGVEDKIKELAKFLVTEDGKNYKIKILGETSAANPSSGFNTQLAKDRANNTAEYLRNLMLQYETEPPKLGGTDEYYPAESTLPLPKLTNSKKQSNDRWEIESRGQEKPIFKCSPNKECINNITGKLDCCDGDPCDSTLEEGQANSKKAKEARYASIRLEVNTVLQANILNRINQKNKSAFDEEQKLEEEKKQQTAELVAKYFINECDYFEELKRTNPFIYSSLGEKIKNFHPAFHAITPEGFNARLTFLQQCTRQGPQMIDPESPQNMVFGRPPICVLRIGDFYHTKIVIDSVNFTFDPLQWDLNPEGIGVQPMIAKVDIGFKFIGGSSLGGPIKQLQNAVSFNFFANTGVYNPAKVAESALEDRRKFIYGAFITPWEADKKYQEVQKDYNNRVKNNNVSVNNNQSVVATQPNDLKQTINETSQNLNNSSTSGSAPSLSE